MISPSETPQWICPRSQLCYVLLQAERCLTLTWAYRPPPSHIVCSELSISREEPACSLVEMAFTDTLRRSMRRAIGWEDRELQSGGRWGWGWVGWGVVWWGWGGVGWGEGVCCWWGALCQSRSRERAGWGRNQPFETEMGDKWGQYPDFNFKFSGNKTFFTCITKGGLG